MNTFLHPGFYLLGRMSNEVKFPLMALLFGFPLYFFAFATPGPASQLIGCAALAATIYMSVAFYHQAMRGWHDVLPLLERLSHGDLTASYFNADRAGQFAEVRGIAGDLNGHFTRIVTQTRSGVERITATAREIAAANASLENRTQSQASTLEEIAAGMEEFSATVRANADSCDGARALAAHANRIAEGGGEMVRRVSQTMEHISEMSSRVDAIVGVINSIAFQTNILALNAAVEAARAGEEGRGFAVVASEVRVLAQRSAQAAREIGTLIEASGAGVQEGAAFAVETGKTIAGVVEVVAEVAARIQEIAAASAQQSGGMDRINSALTELDQLAQQNAALVGDSSKAAADLEQEAARLELSSRRFKLKPA